MARPREPINLIMIKGKKHLTKEEIQNRKQSEIQPCTNSIQPPSYLNAKQKKRFLEIADQLQKLEIMGETDCDALARYVTSETLYQQAVKDVQAWEKQRPTDANDFENWLFTLEKLDKRLDRYFKQAQTAASGLGMTISSRCRIIIPKTPEQPKENKFQKFVKAVDE